MRPYGPNPSLVLCQDLNSGLLMSWPPYAVVTRRSPVFAANSLKGLNSLTPIAKKDHLQDFWLMLARGNHKSALDDIKQVTSMLKDEAHHMWQLPLPPWAALELPGAVLAPVGLAHQLTINEHGESFPSNASPMTNPAMRCRAPNALSMTGLTLCP
jgi:hypothetical protein